MNEFFIFLKTYWREIAYIVSAAISLVFTIILLVKKNRNFDVYSKALSKTLVNIPGYISFAEASGLVGPEKKLMVIKMALKDLADSFGRELSEDESNYIQGLLSTFIEYVLCTPQKKGILKDGKK